VAGLPVDIQTQSDAYVHYEFVNVECQVCGEKSNNFVYKEHLEAEEQIAYIELISGFAVRKSDNLERIVYVNTCTNYEEGGLACPTCQGIEIEEREVSNG